MSDKSKLDAMNLAQIGYEAYCEAAGGTSLVSGAPLPKFDDLKSEIKFAWVVGATAVSLHVLDHTKNQLAARLSLEFRKP